MNNIVPQLIEALEDVMANSACPLGHGKAQRFADACDQSRRLLVKARSKPDETAAELERVKAVNRELASALRECVNVFDLPEVTPDGFGTCYTASQRSGTIASAKISARAALAKQGGVK